AFRRPAETLAVCPAARASETAPPARCGDERLRDISLANRVLWLVASFDLPDGEVLSDAPSALFVALKGSTRAYVNGVEVGSNGVPGDDSASEVPGQLDAVFFLPRGILRRGVNEVALLVSGHHVPLIKSQDVHQVALTVYQPSHLEGSASFLVLLLTFGMFVLGAIYFGASAWLSDGNRTSPASLAVASLLTACQLLAESLRGLWAYRYPVQGLRLAAIAFLAAGVGVALVAHVCARFDLPKRGSTLLAVSGASLLAFWIAPDFDSKALSVVAVTSLASAALAFWARPQPGAVTYALAFLSLALLNFADPVEYFDVYAFVALAALLLFLFAQEARALRRLEYRHGAAEGRLLQLEADLARLHATDPPVVLNVRSAGRSERIASREIAAVSAAGDYVELQLVSGRTVLHNCTLSTLERELPSQFLRVHRSHLVNTEHVVELLRSPSGIGELRLVTEVRIPVSRRTLPKVRQALSR
ncbi:MAG: LytTR family DNA-binding domain-containing protein, partial [Myxococcota bacterium]